MKDKTLYLIDESKWSNQRHLYNDCIQSITNRDTFILTRANRVCHQPWQCFYLIPDKNMTEKEIIDTDKIKHTDGQGSDEANHQETKTKTEPNKFSDNQFFGPWFTYKTNHSIVFNGTIKDSVPNMVERLQLVKCWEITPVPQVLRK